MHSTRVAGEWPAEVCATNKPMNREAGAGGRKLAAWEMDGVMRDYKGGRARADANLPATA
jgi:hypothetical protein